MLEASLSIVSSPSMIMMTPWSPCHPRGAPPPLFASQLVLVPQH